MVYTEDEKKRLERHERKTTYIPQGLMEFHRKSNIAQRELAEFQDAIKVAQNPLNWSLEDWRSFLQSTPKESLNIV